MNQSLAPLYCRVSYVVRSKSGFYPETGKLETGKLETGSWKPATHEPYIKNLKT